MRRFQFVLLRQIEENLRPMKGLVEEMVWQGVINDIHEPHFLASGDDILRDLQTTRPAGGPLGKIHNRDRRGRGRSRGHGGGLSGCWAGKMKQRVRVRAEKKETSSLVGESSLIGEIGISHVQWGDFLRQVRSIKS